MLDAGEDASGRQRYLGGVPDALVTLSAQYGAGGSYVGPRLAERMGVAFVDRAIPSEVARRLAVPLAEAVRRDEAIGSLFDRMVRLLAPVGAAYGARPSDPEALDEQAYRLATEEVIREEAGIRGGVILGRAGALVLAGVPGALHVRLYGPEEARVEQAMRLEGLGGEEAQKRLAENDRAREAYVRHFYGADSADLRHYHLALDSTAFDLDDCVDLIAEAAEALR
jgi:cytidylate kinase